jgi:hypothetical protein
MKYTITFLALLLSTLTFANSVTTAISGFIKNSTYDKVSIKSSPVDSNGFLNFLFLWKRVSIPRLLGIKLKIILS